MSSLIIGSGGESDRASIQLATRLGRFIPNERRPENLPERRRAAVELWQDRYPDAVLRSITALYNCMGLVFASRRTCVDIAHLGIILQDDGYRQLNGPEGAQLGDLVIYRNRIDNSVTHVAVIIDIEANVQDAIFEVKVISKWGADGEYIHHTEDAPKEYGEPLEYWTDRRPCP